MIVKFEHLNKIRMSFFNKTIVLCHGCFDIFHIGHLNYLMKSKKMGDILVVSVTNDEFVRKGNNRPIFNIHDRLSIINSLNMVNYCVIPKISYIEI
jgi:cytidyltransferase-like protein